MLEPEDCLDILSIVRYKTQLLDIIDEAARLSESERHKKAECIGLRLEISSLKSDLSSKELELATVDRTIEDGITCENEHILSKENEELKVLRDNLKSLLESTQNKLKECELEKYNAKQELEACKSLTRTRDRGLESSVQLFDKFISMQGHAAKKFDDLQQALNDVKKERSEVLKKQLDMQTELEGLKAAIDDYHADEQKYRQHTEQLKEQLIASSASLERLREEVLTEKERRKELEGDLSRASQRIVELSESREQLAEALRAAYLGREALGPRLSSPLQTTEHGLSVGVERVTCLGGNEERRKCDLFRGGDGPQTVMDSSRKTTPGATAKAISLASCPGIKPRHFSDDPADSDMVSRTTPDSSELHLTWAKDVPADDQTKQLEMNHFRDSHAILFETDMTKGNEENVCGRRKSTRSLAHVRDTDPAVKLSDWSQWILSGTTDSTTKQRTGSQDSSPHTKDRGQKKHKGEALTPNEGLPAESSTQETAKTISLPGRHNAAGKTEAVKRTPNVVKGECASSPDFPVVLANTETAFTLLPQPLYTKTLDAKESVHVPDHPVVGACDAVDYVHDEQPRAQSKLPQNRVSSTASTSPEKVTASAHTTAAGPFYSEGPTSGTTDDPRGHGVQIPLQDSDDPLHMTDLSAPAHLNAPVCPVPDIRSHLEGQHENEGTQASVQFDCDALLNAICL